MCFHIETMYLRLFSAAFNRAAAEGPMTEFEVIVNEPGIDGFRRSGKDGHGILCLFNRSGSEFVPDLPDLAGFVNAETGEKRVAVSSNACALFLREANKSSGKRRADASGGPDSKS